MTIKVILISLLLSVVLTPISDFFFKEIHLEERLASEYQITAPAEGGTVIARGIDVVKFYRTRPLFYFYSNRYTLLNSFVIALIASLLSLRLNRQKSTRNT